MACRHLYVKEPFTCLPPIAWLRLMKILCKRVMMDLFPWELHQNGCGISYILGKCSQLLRQFRKQYLSRFTLLTSFANYCRFASSKSGKIYLHTDVRMIIFRKSDLDTAADHNTTPGKLGGFELRSFTNGPSNPKFSPRKISFRQEEWYKYWAFIFRGLFVDGNLHQYGFSYD